MPENESQVSEKVLMTIEVAYAEPDVQHLISIELAEGSTIWDAVQQSGLLEKYSVLADQGTALRENVGIFGKLKSADTVLRANDRVEIYRPLLMDPKEARRLRAIADKE